MIRAVDEYADLLRMAAASAGNDHRLGGHEAPPAVISIFLGESLTSILEHIAYGSAPERHSRGYIMEDIAALPTIHRDDCDRNRTSPFAFTGNKFEYRMVGSSASIASATYVLNTAVADVLSDMADRLAAAPDREAEIDRIIGDLCSTGEWSSMATTTRRSGPGRPRGAGCRLKTGRWRQWKR
ncbi:MAG: hypothetical protein ACLSAP_10040 [Oscillospiraceae bacterium]